MLMVRELGKRVAKVVKWIKVGKRNFQHLSMVIRVNIYGCKFYNQYGFCK